MVQFSGVQVQGRRVDFVGQAQQEPFGGDIYSKAVTITHISAETADVKNEPVKSGDVEKARRLLEQPLLLFRKVRRAYPN